MAVTHRRGDLAEPEQLIPDHTAAATPNTIQATPITRASR
jgi:hypothetical protein